MRMSSLRILDITRMIEAMRRLPDELFWFVTHHRSGTRIDKDRSTMEIFPDHALAHRIQDQLYLLASGGHISMSPTRLSHQRVELPSQRPNFIGTGRFETFRKIATFS